MDERRRCAVETPSDVVRRIDRLRARVCRLRDDPALGRSAEGTRELWRLVEKIARADRKIAAFWGPFGLPAVMGAVPEEAPWP